MIQPGLILPRIAARAAAMSAALLLLSNCVPIASSPSESHIPPLLPETSSAGSAAQSNQAKGDSPEGTPGNSLSLAHLGAAHLGAASLVIGDSGFANPPPGCRAKTERGACCNPGSPVRSPCRVRSRDP